jgi:hypothetical protein
MQTITVAQVSEAGLDKDKFSKNFKSAKLRRELKTPEKRYELLQAMAVAQLPTKVPLLDGIIAGVIRRTRQESVFSISLDHGFLVPVEKRQRLEEYTRVWCGHEKYALFCFMSGFPGGSYSAFRQLLAEAFTGTTLKPDQKVVVPVRYDLNSVRSRFRKNIWDQNFVRNDPIRRGRIFGVKMQEDPLFQEFSNIATFIGVEIPIVNSHEMVKVFSDGRLQFMSLQPSQIEDETTRENALNVIVQVIDKLAKSEK